MTGTERLDAWEWFGHRTFHHSQFSDPADLIARKRALGATVTVCIPTRNERETIGPILRCIRTELMEAVPLVDQLLVIDGASGDGTVDAAAAEGAEVHQEAGVAADQGDLGGKGDALWKSLFVARGDLVAFVDADIRNFEPRFVLGLLGPLLSDPTVGYVKAFYERPLSDQGVSLPNGGGRVTELLARPLINMFFPTLAAFVQPLSGEYAGRREVLERVPFLTGYGVELGLLIDIAETFGLESIAQVDLDERVHRNRTMPELSRMAFGILQGALRKLDDLGKLEMLADPRTHFLQFANLPGQYHMEASEIEVLERPPAASVASYAATRA